MEVKPVTDMGVVPFVQVIFQGAVPESATDIIAAPPLQILWVPEIAAEGAGNKITFAVPEVEPDVHVGEDTLTNVYVVFPITGTLSK